VQVVPVQQSAWDLQVYGLEGCAALQAQTLLLQ
jgi:hypothetical protein